VAVTTLKIRYAAPAQGVHPSNTCLAAVTVTTKVLKIRYAAPAQYLHTEITGLAAVVAASRHLWVGKILFSATAQCVQPDNTGPAAVTTLKIRHAATFPTIRDE
jgi:hypothetical protein